MEDDAKIVVGTEVNDKEFQKDVDEMVEYVENAGEESGEEFTKGFEKKQKVNSILTRIFSKMTGLGKGMASSLATVVTALTTIGLKLGPILAILGLIGGAVYIVGMAFKKVFDQNQQLAVEFKYILYVIQQGLQPAINFVANVLEYIIKLIIRALRLALSLINTLTGGRLFANVDAEKFAESLKNSKDSAGGLANNLKDAKKQLAGFDEMNVLQDNSASGGGALLGGMDNQDFEMPTPPTDDWNNFYNDFQTRQEEMRTSLFEMPFDVWTSVFGDWDLALYNVTKTFYELGENIQSFFDLFGGLWKMAKAVIDGDKEEFKKGWEKFKKGFKEDIDSLINIITGAFSIAVGLGKAVGTALRNVIGEWINFAKNRFDEFKDIVGNVWENIKETAKAKIQELKDWFTNKLKEMGFDVGGAFGGSFANAVNVALQWIQDNINGFVRSVNSAINFINKIKIPGVNIGKLREVSLPRLERGGIVNNPGPGVMMGNYVAGEKGPEAVLPLTDDTLQRLASMIPITVNLTNSMNGRVISRELLRVQSENDFAFNR